MVRAAIESLYTGKCTIIQAQEVFDTVTKRTTFEDVAVCENEPCRLSFSTKRAADQNGPVASAEQEIKLFIRPELVILAGSKIVVTQNGKTVKYEAAGESAYYTNHQEVILKRSDWT